MGNNPKQDSRLVSLKRNPSAGGKSMSKRNGCTVMCCRRKSAS